MQCNNCSDMLSCSMNKPYTSTTRSQYACSRGFPSGCIYVPWKSCPPGAWNNMQVCKSAERNIFFYICFTNLFKQSPNLDYEMFLGQISVFASQLRPIPKGRATNRTARALLSAVARLNRMPSAEPMTLLSSLWRSYLWSRHFHDYTLDGM